MTTDEIEQVIEDAEAIIEHTELTAIQIARALADRGLLAGTTANTTDAGYERGFAAARSDFHLHPRSWLAQAAKSADGRDQARADLATLRDKVRALADDYDMRDGTHNHVVADLRALLGEGD